MESAGLPVGMSRNSSPEFRRRVLAAALSHFMGHASIDYTLKTYVDKNEYDTSEPLLGDEVSDYLSKCFKILSRDLYQLQTPHPPFGVFGAEMTLFRVPHALNVSRMLANRGLLLEVSTTLRLCVEMMAWAKTAFNLPVPEKVTALKAPACIPNLKAVYATAGKLYGQLSTFSHWVHSTHADFLTLEKEKAGVVFASVRYRARALALCIVVLDVFVEVIRSLYPYRCDPSVMSVQGTLSRGRDRELYKLASRLYELTHLNELRDIRTLLVVQNG